MTQRDTISPSLTSTLLELALIVASANNHYSDFIVILLEGLDFEGNYLIATDYYLHIIMCARKMP